MKLKHIYLAFIFIYFLVTVIGYVLFKKEIGIQKDSITLFNEKIISNEKKIDSLKELKKYYIEIDSLLNLTNKLQIIKPDSLDVNQSEEIKIKNVKQHNSLSNRKGKEEIYKQKINDSLKKSKNLGNINEQREKDSLDVLKRKNKEEKNSKKSSAKIMALNSVNKKIPLNINTTIFDIKYDPNNGKLVNSIGTDIPKKVIINGKQVIIRSLTEFYHQNNEIAFYRIRVQFGKNVLKNGLNELIITDNLNRDHNVYFNLNN